jgi:hypothetical protein
MQDTLMAKKQVCMIVLIRRPIRFLPPPCTVNDKEAQFLNDAF